MKFLLDGFLLWVCSKLFRSPAQNSQPRLMPAPLLPKEDDAEYTVETREVAPSDLLSKIEAFSLLRKFGFRDYESKEFESGGHKWKLVISLDERWSNHISAYLVLSDTSSLTGSWEVNAILNFFLYNQVRGNYICFRGKVRRFNQLKSKWGFSKLISKKDFADKSNGYLVDDSCVFGAEVFVVKNEGVIDRVSLLKSKAPYKRSWEISNYSKLGHLWSSEAFTADGYRWQVWLYPNGDERDCKGQNVSIFLVSISSMSFADEQKIKVAFYLRLKSKLGETLRSVHFSNWFTPSTTTWGGREFIPVDDMLDPDKGFVVDDCCYVETEIHMQAVAGLPLLE